MYTGGISSRVVDGADQPRDGPSVVVVVDFREREQAGETSTILFDQDQEVIA